MNILNLSELMISLTEFKKQISEVISKKATKVIIKNNEPVSIFMPYSEYVSMAGMVHATGEDITLSNGVVIKVCVETEKDQLAVKTYVKMKTSGEYKLHFTNYISNPNVEQTLTNEEMMMAHGFNSQKK